MDIMIITASRINTSSGAGGVGNHVFNGPKNESIELLQGCPQDLEHMFDDARNGGSKYAVRHFKISPKEAMTREDTLLIAHDYAREFGTDPERLVVVEHKKPRAGGQGFSFHYHGLAGEYDALNGKVLDSHWMRPRHEKLARVAEDRLGHAMVAGRWNKAVAHALTNQHPLVAEQVALLANVKRPESAFTAGQHQKAHRKGKSMPIDCLAVAQAWQQSDGPLAFAAALAEQGISVRQGDKAGIYLAERDGQLIGAVHRLTHEKKETVSQRLKGLEVNPSKDELHPMIGALAPITPDSDGQSEPPPPPPGVPVQTPSAEAPEALAAQAASSSASHGQHILQPPPDDRPSSPPHVSPSSASGGNQPSRQQGAMHDVGAGDPTAGLDIPDAGDLLGWIKYREKLALKAQQIAEAAARKGAPQQEKSKGGNNVSSLEIGSQSQTDKNTAKNIEQTVIRFLERCQRAAERKNAEAAIRIAVRQFEIDCTRIAGHDDSTSSSIKRPHINDNRHTSEHIGSPELVVRLDEYTSAGGPEPDNRNPQLLNDSVGNTAEDRSAARTHIEGIAAARRLERELSNQPSTILRLRELASALQPSPFEHLEGKARFDAMFNARNDLFAQYKNQKSLWAQTEKDRWKSALDQQHGAADSLAHTVQSTGRNSGRNSKAEVYETIKNARQRTVETLKETQPLRQTFDQWVEHAGRTDPVAREIHKATVELREHKQAIAGRLASDRDAIAAILATHPHPDPKDLDQQARADRYAGQISDRTRQRDQAARDAQEHALSAMRDRPMGTRLLASVGIKTHVQRQAEQLVYRALKLTDAADEKPSRDEYQRARADGSAHAYAAQKDVLRWQQKPDIASALENYRLDQLVQSAVKSGDRQVSKAMAQGDPELARSILRERERTEEQQRRSAEEARDIGPKNPRGPFGPKMK